MSGSFGDAGYARGGYINDESSPLILLNTLNLCKVFGNTLFVYPFPISLLNTALSK